MSVRLCFFVKVLKANGLKVAGGSSTGSMLVFGGATVTLKGLMGCAGVPKAGDDDGIGLRGAGVGGALNMRAGRGFSA